MADVNLDKASLYALAGAGAGDIGTDKLTLYALAGAASGEVGVDKATLYALYPTPDWTDVWVKLRNATDGFWVRAPDNALSFNVKVRDGWEL